MKKDGANDPSRPEDDLFDLPSEAAASAGARPARAVPFDVDAPSSALPRRSESIAPAGPPLTTVAPTPSGIFEQIRPQPASAGASPAPIAPPPAIATTLGTSKRNLWLAFGALATANALVLTIVFMPAGAQPGDRAGERAGEHAQTASDAKPERAAAGEPGRVETADADPAHVAAPPVATPAGATAPAVPKPERVAAPLAPRVETNVPVVALPVAGAQQARRSIDDARADLDAGRTAAARAQLARVGLAIDAIDHAQREELRAEIALLLARAVQSEAEGSGMPR